MIKTFIVDCAVYPFHILCYFGEDRTLLYKKLSKFTTKEQLDEIKGFGYKKGKAFMLPGGQTVLWMSCVPESCFDYGILAHEVFHCVVFIMEKVDIKFGHDGEEAFAYLIGYVTKEIMKGLSKTIER
jgi:hypothetical protein